MQDECSEDEFHCDNKACILSVKVCDFRNDCGDLSDEKNCGECGHLDLKIVISVAI